MRWGSGGAGALHSFFVVLVWIFLRHHSGARLLPSFRRKPESILILSFGSLRENRLTSVCFFVRPPGGRVTFFACPKKVTKERAPSRSRCAGIPARALREQAPGFGDSTSLC